MKEIIAVIRMNKTSATKKALVAAGVAGFTAIKVQGRGKLVESPEAIAGRKAKLMDLAIDDISEPEETEKLVTGFLDGSRLFPRRLFKIVAKDDEVSKIVDALIQANRTENRLGDGKIFVLPIYDAVRVRTGEYGEEAL
ncbi:MAG: nifI-2 [Firmicutes bacterium]|nr:nifI-2 [Bacillota bacterium]